MQLDSVPPLSYNAVMHVTALPRTRRLREGWGLLGLCLSLVLVTCLAMASSGWTDGLQILVAVGLGGFVIGLISAKSGLPAGLCHWFSLIIGFAWSFRLVATLIPAAQTWSEQRAALWHRLIDWIVQLHERGTTSEVLLFTLHLSLISWMVSYLATWFIFRSELAARRGQTYRAWLAVLPAGIALLINLAFAPNDLTGYFILFLLISLFLVMRFNLFVREQIWEQARVDYQDANVAAHFIHVGMVLSGVIVALAWLSPPVLPVYKDILRSLARVPWPSLQEKWPAWLAPPRVARVPTASAPTEVVNRLVLGGARHLGDRPVLGVAAPAQLRYWRTGVFDRYTGSEWRNSDEWEILFGGDYKPLPMVDYRARASLSYTVTALSPDQSVLVMAAQPSWVTLRARATLSYADQEPDSRGVQRVDTLSVVRSRVALNPGDQYLVTTRVSQATAQQLRQAGDDYPDWIVPRYLQLPPRLPERVKQLAQRLTAPYASTFDKAAVLEDYLRHAIAYNESVDAPPVGRDPVDYVLFESRQGYCDYYASAMVVLARAAGIPARLATGYAQGAYQADTQQFIVSEKNAHSWVEIFFPDYGWIEFEPTATQPAIGSALSLQTRQPAAADTPARQQSEQINSNPRSPAQVPPPETSSAASPEHRFDPQSGVGEATVSQLVAVIGLLFIAAAAGGWLIYRRRRCALSRAECVYRDMVHLAGRAGVRVRAWQTPFEYASAVGRLAPEAQPSAWRIASLYTRQRYASQGPTAAEQVELERAWQALRARLTRAAVRGWLRRRAASDNTT